MDTLKRAVLVLAAALGITGLFWAQAPMPGPIVAGFATLGANTFVGSQIVTGSVAATVNVSGFLLQSTVWRTTTDCVSVASPAVCGSSSAGTVNLAAAATTIVVNSTALTANSEVFVTNDSSLGTKLSVTCNTQSSLVLGTPRITARVANTSFTVSIDVGPTTNPMCLSYFIMN